MNTVDFPRSRLLRCYALEARCELMRTLRTPSFVLPCLLFPAVFYLLFGVLLASRQGQMTISSYLLASYGVFGIMGVALFGFGVSIAVENERGFLTLKRALPMPPGALMSAKLLMAMSFAAVVSLLLAMLAAGVAGVRLAPWQWIGLFAVNVLGVLPFAALGLCIGIRVSGQAAPAILNLIYLPMAFLSGLWMPLGMLPDLIQRLAPVWPSWHLSQIALAVIGMGDDALPVISHVGVLVAVTLAFLLLARRLLVRAQARAGA